MTHNNIMIIIAFALYLGLMMYIGVYYYRKSNSIGDYILGGRQLGPWITALSAEASDMSGWMLMGVPGLAYTTGISGVWIAVGLTLGTWANWRFVSRRLRNHTEVASDSLTLPDYLKNRFHDQSHSVAVISALFILIFFLIYTSSGFVAGGKLFNTIFGLDYTVSLFITAGIVVFYTFLGGFLAVSWTDCIQGALMFFAILAVPITAAMYLGGPIDTMQLIQSEFPQGLNLWGDTSDMFALVIGIISSLGWGLGYFGQPHILVRFMAISDAKELKKIYKYCYGLGYPFLIGSYFRRPHRSCIYVTRKISWYRCRNDIPRYDGTFIYAIYGGPHLVCSTSSYYEYCICAAISNGRGRY